MPTFDTIEFRQKYTNINEVLYWLVEQAKTGVDYCAENFPKFDTPIDLYNYLVLRVTYKNDPPGVELIQSPGTLFENNFFGVPGAGDCDCFCTLLLATLWANDMNENYIILYGRSKSHPSHISIKAIWNGEPIFLDLTERRVNHERHYPLFQEVKVF